MDGWEHVCAVQKMQEYIMAHLEEEITLEQLGAACGYTPWHALRVFKEQLGQTPFSYLRAARLTRAAQALAGPGDKVLDAALDNGFSSHDGFTRAFTRYFGIPPRRYRDQTPPVRYLTYFPARHAYLRNQERMDETMEPRKVSSTVTVTLAERPARRLIFLRSKKATEYFSFCEEMGCDWHGILNSIPEKFGTAALITLPPRLVRADFSATAAGVEVPADYAKPLPAGYELAELGPCKMLYFQGMPFENEDDYCTAIGIVSEALDHYRPEVLGLRFSDEAAPKFNFGASAATGACLAVPVE